MFRWFSGSDSVRLEPDVVVLVRSRLCGRADVAEHHPDELGAGRGNDGAGRDLVPTIGDWRVDVLAADLLEVLVEELEIQALRADDEADDGRGHRAEPIMHIGRCP